MPTKQSPRRPAAAKPAKPGKPTKPGVDVSAGREVEYPEVKVKLCEGPNAMTVKLAKKFLGWQEEAEGESFGAEYTLVDHNGVKVRCLNNLYNRQLDPKWMLVLAQEILNRRWKFNGEAVIIGRTGLVLSAQHRLCALVVASQMWAEQPHWKDKWETEPVLETVVVVGVDESSGTVNTLDCVKPRSVADVLFCDPNMFPSIPRSERGFVAKSAENAVRVLWNRTGMHLDAFVPHITPGEAVDFIDRHPSLKGLIEHVVANNRKGPKDKKTKIHPKYTGVGYAAALAYLMACSTSDVNDYSGGSGPPSEKSLDFSNLDKAREFWTLLASGAPEVKAIRLATRDGDQENYLFADKTEGGRGSSDERVGTIVRGWLAFLDSGRVRPSDVRLEYAEHPEKGKVLQCYPTVGGIDNPDVWKAVKVEPEEELSEEEVEAAKREVDEQHLEEKRNGRPARPRASEPDDDDAGDAFDSGGADAGDDGFDQENDGPDAPASPPTLADELEKLRDQHGDKILLLKTGGQYVAYGKDAAVVSSLLRIGMGMFDGLQRATFPADKLAGYLRRLTEGGHRVAVCDRAGQEDPAGPEPAAPAPRPKPKAGPKAKPKPGAAK